jgi:hypothetical protein
METRKEICRGALAITKKGKFFSCLERLFLAGIFGCILTLICSYAIHTQFPNFLADVIIFFSLICGLFGYSYNHDSIFLWRFLKPDPENIKKYFQQERKEISEEISSNYDYIAELIKKSAGKVTEVQADNYKLEIKLKELNQELILMEMDWPET